MQREEIFQKLKEQFPNVELQFKQGLAQAPAAGQEGHVGDSFIIIPAEQIVGVTSFLKTQLGFDCLSDETAVDRTTAFEVVYQLFSYAQRHSITLKVILNRETPQVPTVESVWPIANWYEREVYDLFGIVFQGHSDLRRIMMPDDWIGHPLRKDFKEQEEYQGISTTRASLLQ